MPALEPITITSLSSEFWINNIIEQVEYAVVIAGGERDGERGGEVAVDFRNNPEVGWTFQFSPVAGRSRGYTTTVILDKDAFDDEQASDFQAELFAEWNQDRGDNPVTMLLKRDITDFPVIVFTRGT